MLSLTNLINLFYCYYLYARNGLLTVINDRALFFTDFVMGTLSPFIIQLILWNAVFSNQKATVPNFTFDDIIYYYAFALLLARLNNGYDVIKYLSTNIREGTLDVWLIKPSSYIKQRLFTFLGESLLYALPIIILHLIRSISSITDNNINLSILSGLGSLIIILILSQLLSFLLSFTLALLSFWVIEYNILLSFSFVSSALLGGTLLPPSLWPNWLIPIMTYNPYHFTISAPAQYFTTYDSAILIHFLIGSLFYINILYLLICFFWSKGLKTYNSAGG
ncbi:ABC-2 family transporter protein [Bartonella sp. DGB1]|uniref:ABC-2 family transporter protein n=1 Tax=Bartonella sp. DGB1 TaxID=3239807 RepID=UPI003524028C